MAFSNWASSPQNSGNTTTSHGNDDGSSDSSPPRPNAIHLNPNYGNSGGADSTRDGKNYAMQWFDAFLQHLMENQHDHALLVPFRVPNARRPVTYKAIDKKLLLTETTFREFSHYLLKVAKTKAKRDKVETYLSPGTAQQYLSGFKNYLNDTLFPNDPFFANIDTDKSWYKQLYHNLGKDIIRRCIADGESPIQKKKGIGRKHLSKIVRHYVMLNTYEGFAIAISLVLTAHAVGRSGEVAFSTFDKAYWDYDLHVLVFDWGELKNSKEKVCPFFSEYLADEWWMDPYTLFAIYFLLGLPQRLAVVRGDKDVEAWVFPNLAYLSVPSTAINGYLKKCVPIIPRLPDDICGKSLRIGYFNLICQARSGGLAAAIARGDWEAKVDSAAMEYFLHDINATCLGGRLVAGWPDAYAGGSAPSVDSILQLFKPQQRNLFESLVREMMDVDYPALWDSKTSISELPRAAFAALSKNISKIQEDHVPANIAGGSNSIVMTRVKQALSRFGLDIANMIQWGQEVNSAWMVQNAVGCANHNDVACLQASITTLRDSNLQLMEKFNMLTLQHQRDLETLRFQVHEMSINLQACADVIKAQSSTIQSMTIQSTGSNLEASSHAGPGSIPSPGLRVSNHGASESRSGVIAVTAAMMDASNFLSTGPSSSTDSETVAAMPKMFLKQAICKTEGIQSMGLSDLFKSKIKKSFDILKYDKRDQSRINTVFAFLMDLLEPSERAELNGTTEPSTQSSDHSKWTSTIAELANKLSRRAMERLSDLESESASEPEASSSSKQRQNSLHKPTVSSVERRLSNINKKATAIGPQNAPSRKRSKPSH